MKASKDKIVKTIKTLHKRMLKAEDFGFRAELWVNTECGYVYLKTFYTVDTFLVSKDSVPINELTSYRALYDVTDYIDGAIYILEQHGWEVA